MARAGYGSGACTDIGSGDGFAGLDWSVEQWPVRAYDAETDQSIHVPNQVAMVRSDTKAVLGVHTEAYKPLQNREAFSFMDALVEDGQVRYETAGSLKGGKVIWMLARIPTEIRVADTDVSHPYVLLSNSHDGTQSIRVMPTAVRVVCNNTLTWAHAKNRSSMGIRLMHTGDIRSKIAEARHALNLAIRHFERYEEQANEMSQARIDRHTARDYFRDTFLMPDEPSKRAEKSIESRWERLMAIYTDRPTNNMDNIQGTAWAAYNAVSYYVDHEARATGQSGRARTENRMRSSWFGQGAKLKQDAFDRAMELIA